MSGQSDKPRIYLAGPGVFRKDATAFGEMLKHLDVLDLQTGWIARGEEGFEGGERLGG